MRILYEDNHIIVAFKERGILSQADGSAAQDMLTLVKAYIKEKYNKPGDVYLGLVHRLDRNTSGVMVFARTSKAASRLNESIKNHLVSKHYKATVEGILTNSEYVKLVSNLRKDENLKKSFIDRSGKEAILEYKALESLGIKGMKATNIEVNLLTGRFHQIRCQMASIGHPLLGDKKYGSTVDYQYSLCAYSLSFPHPTTKEMLNFTI